MSGYEVLLGGQINASGRSAGPFQRGGRALAVTHDGSLQTQGKMLPSNPTLGPDAHTKRHFWFQPHAQTSPDFTHESHALFSRVCYFQDTILRRKIRIIR